MFDGSELQVVVATHSPFVFDEFDPDLQECVKIDRTAATSSVIELSLAGLPHAPSPSLVAYLSFDVWTEALHIELFDRLLGKHGATMPGQLNRILKAAPHHLAAPSRCVTGGTSFAGSTRPADEVLPVWVRNYLHHSNDPDKRDSSDEMLRLLARR